MASMSVADTHDLWMSHPITNVASMHLYQLSEDLALGLTPSGQISLYDIGVMHDLDECETVEEVSMLLDGGSIVELDHEEAEELFNILQLHFKETPNETVQ